MKKPFTNPTPIMVVGTIGGKEFTHVLHLPNPKAKIQKLPQHRGVKLSSTLSGQRELIREMRNKVNEIIGYINSND